MNVSLSTAARAIAAMAALIGVTACSTSGPPAVTSTASTSTASTSAVSAAPTARSSAGSAASSTNVFSATSSAQREVNPAGDIPDNQAFVPYTSPSGKFTVTVPEGWARTDTATGAVFTDKYNSIRVETRPATPAPTPASIRASEVPGLAGAAANFVLGDVMTVNRKAGPAVLLTYHADTAPNAVTGKVTTAAFERYVFFKAGTDVVITVGAPVGGDNVDPWRTVTDSFSWSA